MTMQIDETFAAALRDLLVEHVESAGTPSRWSAQSRRLIRGPAQCLSWPRAVVASRTRPAYGRRCLEATRSPSSLHRSPPLAAARRPSSWACAPAGATVDVPQLGLPDRWAVHLRGWRQRQLRPGAEVNFACRPTARRSRPGSTARRSPPRPEARWRLVATYASVTTTPWKVNASGQTYGAQNQHGIPDLVAVVATNHRTGYVYASQLFTAPPTNPGQAVAGEQIRAEHPARVRVRRQDRDRQVRRRRLTRDTASRRRCRSRRSGQRASGD